MGKWVKEQQDKVNKAKAMLQRLVKRQWNKKNKHRVPAPAGGRSGRSCGSSSAISKISFVTKRQLKNDAEEGDCMTTRLATLHQR